MTLNGFCEALQKEMPRFKIITSPMYTHQISWSTSDRKIDGIVNIEDEVLLSNNIEIVKQIITETYQGLLHIA